MDIASPKSLLGTSLCDANNKYTISYYRAILESCIDNVNIDDFAVGMRKYITSHGIIETRMLLNMSKILRLCFAKGLIQSMYTSEGTRYIISDKGKTILRILRKVNDIPLLLRE